jgi:hypothetical protein
MTVRIIIDKRNPSRQLRKGTPRYGPIVCLNYKAGPTRRSRGRQTTPTSRIAGSTGRRLRTTGRSMDCRGRTPYIIGLVVSLAAVGRM